MNRSQVVHNVTVPGAVHEFHDAGLKVESYHQDFGVDAVKLSCLVRGETEKDCSGLCPRRRVICSGGD